jgi:ABC-type transporter Mla MlaB component
VRMNIKTLLQQALEQVNTAGGDVDLDFSAVRRIAVDEVCAMEELAGAAAAKQVHVVLHAVNMDVYRVFKLVNLTQRISCVA